MFDTICFAFGEGSDSFFYNAPQQWAWQNLPTGLQQEFRNDEYKYIDVFNLALGPKGAWYISGRRKSLTTGLVVENNAFGGNLPERLTRWLVNRDIRTLRIVFGEAGAFFAWDKDGYMYDRVPIKLASYLEGFKHKGGLSAIMPKCLALGYGESFFFLSQTLLFCYELSGCSAQLERDLNGKQELNQGQWLKQVKHFSINLYKPAEYLIIDNQGNALGNYSYMWDKACNPVHHSIKILFDPSAHAQSKGFASQSPVTYTPSPLLSNDAGVYSPHHNVSLQLQATSAGPFPWRPSRTAVIPHPAQVTQLATSAPQYIFQHQQFMNVYTSTIQAQAQNQSFQQPQISSPPPPPPPYPGGDGDTPQPFKQQLQVYSRTEEPQSLSEKQEHATSEAATKKPHRMSAFKTTIKSKLGALSTVNTIGKPTRNEGDNDTGSVFGGSNRSRSTLNPLSDTNDKLEDQLNKSIHSLAELSDTEHITALAKIPGSSQAFS